MKRNSIIGLIAALGLVVASLPASAVTQDWNPGGTPSAGGLWDTTTANWNSSFGGSGNVVWSQGNDAAFTVSTVYVVTVNAAVTVGNLTVLGSASGPMTLVQSAGKQLNFASGAHTLDTGTRTVTVTGADFAGGSGVVITKKGTGTLSMSSVNGSYAGKWVVQDGGYLSVGTGTASPFFGTSTADDAITLNNAGIRCSAGTRTVGGTGITLGAGNYGIIQAGAATVTIDVKSKISGSGTFTVNGATAAGGTILLDNAANAYTGDTVLASGSGSSSILKLGVAGAVPTGSRLVMNASTKFDMAGLNDSVKSISGTAGTIDLNGGTLTLSGPAGESFNGVIQSTTAGGKLVKNGSGALTLGGANTFNGGVTINGGTIALGASTTALGSGKLTLNGGSFATSGFSETTAGTLALSSSSTLDLGAGASALAFGNSMAEGWAGTLNVLGWTDGVDTLRFGTDGTGLTPAQLAEINFGDISGFVGAAITPDGYLVPLVPEPSSVALAVLGGFALAIGTIARRKI